MPLYNVAVYVPNGQPKPIREGVSCDRCQAGNAGSVATAFTDAKGAFTLNDVPVGDGIPLVIEVGKWRREIKIPTVSACANTVLEDKDSTRLPRNQTEGHIPKIALTTGGVDALECLLRKIGIEDSEFTPEAGNGRVNLFAGGTHLGSPESTTSAGTNAYSAALNAGAMFTDAGLWWDSVDNLKKYDIVLHSCDGLDNPRNKSAAALQALQSYTDLGGRVFASHYQNYWIRAASPPLSTIGTFTVNANLSMIVSAVDTTFPGGMALADWLVHVGASTVRGELPIVGGKRTIGTINAMVAQRWVYLDMPASIQYLTANTPVGAPADTQCGRVVFSDLHVSSGLGRPTDDRSVANDSFVSSRAPSPFPTGCVSTEMSPQEKALAFMLFDLSSCIGRN